MPVDNGDHIIKDFSCEKKSTFYEEQAKEKKSHLILEDNSTFRIIVA